MGLTVPDLFGSTPFVHVAAYACEVIAILMLSQDQSVLPWLLSGVSDYKPVSACFFHSPTARLRYEVRDGSTSENRKASSAACT